MPYDDDLNKLFDELEEPTLEELVEQGDSLVAENPTTPEGERDADAGVDETPDDVEPDEDEDSEFDDEDAPNACVGTSECVTNPAIRLGVRPVGKKYAYAIR